MRINVRKPSEINLHSACTVIAIILVAVQPASGDDGYISIGGNPHLMDRPTTVSMQSEKVDIDVEDNLVTVDCQFVFKNTGKACSVRMGFPDQSTSRSEIKKPEGSFSSYKSYVDGKEVPTETVLGSKKKGNEGVWHAKTVDFPANSTRLVRDVYTDIESGFQVPPDGAVHFFSYVLHTASSWKGKVEDADISIKLNTIKTPIRIVHFRSVPRQMRTFWLKAPANTVVYAGPCKPEVSGRSLRFHVQNLRPTDDSDISLLYGYEREEEGQ